MGIIGFSFPERRIPKDSSYADDGVGIILWLEHFWSHKTTRRSVLTSHSAAKQGRFNIAGVLPEQDYEIRVGSEDPNRRYCIAKLAWNGQPLSDTNVVRTAKGETTRLEAWLVRAAALSGIASNGAHVQLERMDAQPFETQIYPDIQFSDYVEQNRFYIPGIPPGKYRVRVERINRMFEITLQPGEVKELMF